MLILFLRSAIIYCLVFMVIRLMGKRSIQDLHPFDLVVTLLIADLASQPISDTSVPLAYGVIPILALFLMQQLVSYFSLKSEKARMFFCGKPVIVISKGEVQERVLAESSYTLNDLLEQLREKDVFDITEVEYAILETSGSLTVLKKGRADVPTREDLKIKSPKVEPAHMLILDGCIHERVLKSTGHSMEWMLRQIQRLGFKSPKHLLFLSYNVNGEITGQAKSRYGGRLNTIKADE